MLKTLHANWWNIKNWVILTVHNSFKMESCQIEKLQHGLYNIQTHQSMFIDINKLIS